MSKKTRTQDTPGKVPDMFAKGFTLIELMIVIVIVAILATIAYPSFIEQIRKSRRADAHTALLDAASRQVQFFLDNKTYTIDMMALGYTTNPANSPDGHYTFVATIGTAPPSFTLTATPAAGSTQAKDSRCTDFSLDEKNNKDATTGGGYTSRQCWNL